MRAKSRSGLPRQFSFGGVRRKVKTNSIGPDLIDSLLTPIAKVLVVVVVVVVAVAVAVVVVVIVTAVQLLRGSETVEEEKEIEPRQLKMWRRRGKAVNSQEEEGPDVQGEQGIH